MHWTSKSCSHVTVFTISVFLGSTCRSETGNTASASLRWAARWFWCTSQICCNKKEGKQCQVTATVTFKGQTEREMLTWIPGPMAASADPCHCTSPCSFCVSARGKRNGSESCTCPADGEALSYSKPPARCLNPTWVHHKLSLFSFLIIQKFLSFSPPLGWSTCWTSWLCKGTL